MPQPVRAQYPVIRVLVALAIILPYEIAMDFHTSFLPLFIVAMCAFGAGHLVELLIASSKKKSSAPGDRDAK